MLGVSFIGKRDARSLFLLPVGMLTPLRRSSPTGGFYELSLGESGETLALVRRG